LTLGGPMDVQGDLLVPATTKLDHASAFLQPDLVWHDVIIAASTALVGPTILDGDLTIADQNTPLNVGPWALTIGGDLWADGFLRMNDPAGEVVVDGSARFRVGWYVGGAGYYTAGLMRIGGDFTQVNWYTNDSFPASGTHTVRLEGTDAEVRFDGPTTSYFRRLEIAPGASVTFATNILTTDRLDLSGTLVVAPSMTATIQGLFRMLTGATLTNNGTVSAGSCDFSAPSTRTGNAASCP
jgi:hypothetical protein